MPSLFDWIDTLSKPPDNAALKDLSRWKQIDESFKRGDRLENVEPEDTLLGKQLVELHKLRDEFSQYRSEEAAYHAAEEHRAKVAERKGFLRGVASTLIVTIIGNLFIYYWPSIVTFFTGIFQNLSPP